MYPTAALTHSIPCPLPTALPAPWHLQASCILSTTVSPSHSIPCPFTMVPKHPVPHGIFISAEEIKVFSGKQVSEGDGKRANKALGWASLFDEGQKK